MNWIAIYLLVGLIIGLLYLIFAKGDLKDRFKKASEEKLMELVNNDKLDKGEYEERTVYAPKPNSDIPSRATIEAFESIKKMNRGSLTFVLMSAFIFFWLPVLISYLFSFLKRLFDAGEKK